MYKKCEEILSKLENEGKIKISDYQFPQPQELKTRLKDILEDDVDEKYYLSDISICQKYFNEYIEVREATKKGYKEAYEGDSVNLAYPDSKTRRGRVGQQLSQTLTTSDNMGVVVNE